MAASVQEIVKKFLGENGFDGLFSPDSECGCELSDLFPCFGEIGTEKCIPGYKADCTMDCEHEGAEEGAWHIQREKP